MVGQNINPTSAGLEVKPRYLIYHRLTNTVEEGDISLVKDEILRYLLAKIESRIEDVIIELEQLLRDMRAGVVVSSDIDTLIKYSEILRENSNLIAGYIILSRLSSYNELIDAASEYLAVEDFNESLKDEIEMLINHEEYEKAEMLKKCENAKWIGFGIDDEYGSIVCEVSE